jgi:protease YdgD
MRRSLGAAVFACAVLFAHAAGPRAAPLPGIGPRDPRVVADPASMPWAAIARLNVPGVSRCSAVIVAPRWAVTALHCLYSRALAGIIPPSAIHVLLGYADGGFRQHMIADAIQLPAGAEPGRTTPRGSDFALLHLPQDALAVLPPFAPAIVPGVPLMAGGYGQDRAERLAIDPACRARGYVRGQDNEPLLQHDCTATRGASGDWRRVGIAVAARSNGAGGVAVPGDAVARLLAAQP